MQTDASRQIEIHVGHDHLEQEARSPDPVKAIAELIWNGLDADADEVEVRLTRGKLDAIEQIEVVDNGNGILPEDAQRFFSSLGDSWKKDAKRTKEKGRFLHGKNGKGRLKAFSLGCATRWQTTYSNGNEYFTYQIKGDNIDLRRYDMTEPQPAEHPKTGTTVVITNIKDDLRGLDDADAVARSLSSKLALQLRRYPRLHVRFDGRVVDPKALEAQNKDYPLQPLKLSDGKTYDAVLSVIEWVVPMSRTLCLCDSEGFTYDERPPGVQEPGFDFTAYLRSDAVDSIAERNAFGLDELDPDLKLVLDSAKRQIKGHFRARRSEEAAGQIKRWKDQGVYPYNSEPISEVDVASRQVFNIVAMQVQDYVPGFGEDTTATRFSMRLLREAVEDSPEHLRRIIDEVLDLPE